MKFTSKNAFPGAVVTLNDTELTVYKVNSKTFYAGPVPFVSYLNKLSNYTGAKKKFFDTIGAEKYSYGDAVILNVDMKETFEYINERREQQNEILTEHERKEIRGVYERQYLQERPFRTPVHFGAKMVVVVACNPDGLMLIRAEEDWAFWDSELNLFYPFIKERDKVGKDLIWPEKIRLE